jgi:DNA transposition AAA+ family ATPase
MNTTQQLDTETNQPNGIAAMNARKMRIPGDVVNRATADLPDDQRSLIRWLHSHAVDQNLSLDELGKLVRYDSSTIHRIFHGRYEGNIARVCQEIADFKKIHEQRQQGKKLDFIETELSKKIWRVLDAAREFQRIAFIIGASQSGKTTAIIEYARRFNHGSTIYVRMSTGGAFIAFLRNLATALRISANNTQNELINRTVSAFDDRMLLIVDEIHQCCFGRADTAPRTIEFIRELHDTARCGVVLCGTPVFDDEMENGRMSNILLQTKRRRLCKLMLPDEPTRADLDRFAAAYGLPPATGEHLKLQSSIIKSEALGMWLTMLRMAAKIAARRGEKMTWSHVSQAHAGLMSLETVN